MSDMGEGSAYWHQQKTIEQAIEALENSDARFSEYAYAGTARARHQETTTNLRALLEQMEKQEPVAIVKLIEHLPDEYELLAVFNKPLLVGDGDKLYTTPQLPQKEGWQWVPGEPFNEALDILKRVRDGELGNCVAYRMLIAAAPKPTEGE